MRGRPLGSGRSWLSPFDTKSKWGWGPTRSARRQDFRHQEQVGLGVGPRSRFTRVGAGGWDIPPSQRVGFEVKQQRKPVS